MEEKMQDSKPTKTAETALIILETIKMYAQEAVTYNVLQYTTSVRLIAAIDYLSVAYTQLLNDSKSNGKDFPYVNKLTISLSDLFAIKDMAKPVEREEKEIVVKGYTDIARTMLTKFIKHAISRGQKEVLNEDIDKLLSAMSKVDELIDSSQ